GGGRRGGRRAGGEGGRQRGALGRARRSEDGVGRQTRARQERAARELPAELLEGDSELEEPEALAAVSLRDREPLQPQLGRHLLPDGAVEAHLGLGETPHLPDRPALLDEAPPPRPQLL